MKKIACVVLTALAAFLVAGAAGAADDLLQKVKERGVLRVCNVAYTPWNIKNPTNNQWEGINPEIATEIAGMLKVKLEHVDAAWATFMQSVTTGKCDMAMTPSWITPARAEIITFTAPYAEEGMGVFVPVGSAAKTIAELDQPGKTIAAISGSADERVAKETFKKATVKSIVSDKAGAAILEVAARRADGATGGYFGNIMFIKENAGLKVTPMEGVFLNPTPFGYAVPPREYFFRDWLNAALINLDATGKKKAIIAKWTKLE
jgi:polar amino acid transport system substrate-binding protein